MLTNRDPLATRNPNLYGAVGGVYIFLPVTEDAMRMVACIHRTSTAVSTVPLRAVSLYDIRGRRHVERKRCRETRRVTRLFVQMELNDIL